MIPNPKLDPVAFSLGEQTDWPVFVCKQGAFLYDPRVHHQVDSEAVVGRADMVAHDLEAGRVILPSCRVQDNILRQPPLGINLTCLEAKSLIVDVVGAGGVFAATDIGPKGQDKASNQDFALSATLRIPGSDDTSTCLQFAAVADGVSTKTLWPERSARIAVLSAWRTARRHAEAGNGFTHQEFATFRDELSKTIRAALEADMNILRAHKSVPSGWSPDTYHQYENRRDLWYNSTLIVALVGKDAGFLLSCGDGGLVVHKTEGNTTRSTILVKSTDELGVHRVVSLAPGAMHFAPVRVTLNLETRLEIIITTDGVDRSIRKPFEDNGGEIDPYANVFTDLHSSDDLLQVTKERLEAIPEREIDNISVAILRWPVELAPLPRPPTYIGSIQSTRAHVDHPVSAASAPKPTSKGTEPIPNLALAVPAKVTPSPQAIDGTLTSPKDDSLHRRPTSKTAIHDETVLDKLIEDTCQWSKTFFSIRNRYKKYDAANNVNIYTQKLKQTMERLEFTLNVIIRDAFRDDINFIDDYRDIALKYAEKDICVNLSKAVILIIGYGYNRGQKGTAAYKKLLEIEDRIDGYFNDNFKCYDLFNFENVAYLHHYRIATMADLQFLSGWYMRNGLLVHFSDSREGVAKLLELLRF